MISKDLQTYLKAASFSLKQRLFRAVTQHTLLTSLLGKALKADFVSNYLKFFSSKMVGDALLGCSFLQGDPKQLSFSLYRVTQNCYLFYRAIISGTLQCAPSSHVLFKCDSNKFFSTG